MHPIKEKCSRKEQQCIDLLAVYILAGRSLEDMEMTI
jgi:hypothetical protein